MSSSFSRRLSAPARSLLPVLALLSAALPALGGDVLLLDRAGRTVSRVNAATLEVRGLAAMPEAPTRVVLSPDGSTAVLLCRGQGDDKYDGFKAKTKSWAVFLAAGTMKEKARVELGSGIGPASWDVTGARFVVLAPGFPHTDPGKRQTATVVSIDREGKARSVSLGRAAADMVVSPDASVAAVLASRVEGPAQVVFVDLAEGTASEPVPLATEAKELLLAPDGDTLYALSRGKPKGFGNVQGSLAVFSLRNRKKTGDLKLCAITAVGGFDRTGRLVLGGGKAGDVKEPRLYVIRGSAVEYDVPGPNSPMQFLFSPDGRSASTTGWESARIEFGDFSAPPAVTVWKFGGKEPFDVTPDGRLALLHSSDGQGVSEVLIYEMPSGRKVKSFDTASFGARLGAGLAAAAATLGSMEAGRRDAQASGRSTYTYSIYGPKTEIPKGKAIVIRPDGRVAYVYDTFGSTVLAIDLEKVEKGKRQSVGSGSRGLFLTGGGKVLLIATEKGLSVFDAVEFGEPVVTKTDGPADIAMGPSGEALLLAGGLVAVIDPATGRVGPRKTDYKDPAIGLFLP